MGKIVIIPFSTLFLGKMDPDRISVISIQDIRSGEAQERNGRKECEFVRKDACKAIGISV